MGVCRPTIIHTNHTVCNTYPIGFKSDLHAANALPLVQVDIVVDETFALDPTSYNLSSFLTNLNLSSSDDYAFLTNKAVLR